MHTAPTGPTLPEAGVMAARPAIDPVAIPRALGLLKIHHSRVIHTRAAVQAEKPLQVIGAINAYHARLAQRTGYKAIYLSGGGVAAGSLGLPDLGISGLDDVLVDVRRITDVCELPLLWARREGVDLVNGYKIARSDPLHRIWIGRLYH